MIPKLQQRCMVPQAIDHPRAPSRSGVAARFTLDRATPAPTPPREAPATAVAMPRVLEELEVRRPRVDGAIQRALRGAEFSPAELIALQAQVYAYNEQVELVTRVVDKSVGSLKNVLNTQL